MRILFLDDDPDRHAAIEARHPGEVTHAYDIWDFQKVLDEHDHFDVVSLDYDLNDFGSKSICCWGEANGRDACGLMVKHRAKVPTEILLHTSNDEGAQEMDEFLRQRGFTTRRVSPPL